MTIPATVQAVLTTITCSECGIAFGVPEHWRSTKRSDHSTFWCPNGHRQHYPGESGPGARPFDVSWARSTVEQCRTAGVACFVKQMGSQPTIAADDVKTWPSQVPPHVGIEVSSYSGPGAWPVLSPSEPPAGHFFERDGPAGGAFQGAML